MHLLSTFVWFKSIAVFIIIRRIPAWILVCATSHMDAVHTHYVIVLCHIFVGCMTHYTNSVECQVKFIDKDMVCLRPVTLLLAVMFTITCSSSDARYSITSVQAVWLKRVTTHD